MNFMKIGTSVRRLLKFSISDVSAITSSQCTYITKEALYACSIRAHGTNSIVIDNEKLNHGYRTTILTDSDQYKVKGDPDTFGDYGDKNTFEHIRGDEGDEAEEDFIENPPDPKSKLRPKQYADMVKTCLSEKRYADAFDVLETRMLKIDRVKPESYIYNLLINACGRCGYTKKGFQLYNQMKKRGLKVRPATYTALFNACSNSPWPDDGLQRAKHLRELMLEKGIEFNATHYHAMMKAFGRHGDLNTAFALVDEMITNGYQLNAVTFSFLLQACISDPEAGFRHSILVWRKMLEKKVKPDLFLYNLMLRSVRDCGIGDSVVAQNVLGQISQKEGNLSLSEGGGTLMIESNQDIQENLPAELNVEVQHNESNENSEVNRKVTVSRENRPNLLAPIPHLGNIIQISEVLKPQDRLLLVGGCSGILQLIADEGLTPDIRTFTLLLDCIPPTISAENALLSAMNKHGIEFDVDFFNMLIKKRSMRFDYENARDVLKLIQQAKLYPDIVTFGVLALSCKTEDEARQLCMDMRNAGYRMNCEILDPMLKSACIRHDFHYVWKVVNIAKEESIKLDKQFMVHLELLYNSTKELLRNKKTEDVPKCVQNKDFVKNARTFMYRYKAWLEEVEIEEDPHPWQQFRKKQHDKKEPKFSKRKELKYNRKNQ